MEKETREVWMAFEKELAQFPWFRPVNAEIVGGKFDPADALPLEPDSRPAPGAA